MIDTHCHLLCDDYDNLDELITKCDENNIKCIVNGCNYNSNIEALELSKKYKNIFSALGYHPEDIETFKEEYLNIIIDNIDSIVAVGEIGLDYHWNIDNKLEQKKLFELQLELAEKYNKPVIVHTRDSIQDTYDILSKYNVKGVIHSFSGSYEMAQRFINLGFKIGVGGVITFKNCNLKDVISKIDMSNIVLETDSPYLSPVPFRGKKNTPLNLEYIAKFIADIKNISCEEVCNITTLNAIKLFDLDNKI